MRRVASVALVNQSADPITNVIFTLADGKGRELVFHQKILAPGGSFHVEVRTSDLIVRRVVGEYRKKVLIYDAGAGVTPGEVFLAEIDGEGRINTRYK